ncbi:MAG: hypothetical protein AAGE94_00345 [Acidobacteriota bacterium]
MDRDFQARQISKAGAKGAEIDELLAYNENHFDLGALGPDTVFPLPDEPFVECWQTWAEEAEGEGAFPVLRRYLPQFAFPIVEGVSQWPSYRKATLQGADPSALDEATGLVVEDPSAIRLELYSSLAGRVPVLALRGRSAFVAMVRALGKRNEPVEIPDSMGALMIAGFNNWHRIHGLRTRFLATPEDEREHPSWREAFAAIRPQKALYQDRFMLLSDGPYSAVPAGDLGLSEADWREKSLIIRRDHECAHYFTRRLFGSMRNNLHDELIADYAGIVAAEGCYRADWFLRFVGLESFPDYRPGGRLDLYRGDPALSDGAFRALHVLVVRAAEHLERFDHAELGDDRTPHRQALALATLAGLRLDELASPEGAELLSRSLADLEARMARPAIG